MHVLSRVEGPGVKIPVQLYTGSQREARLFACGANTTNGLSLTNAEKRRLPRYLRSTGQRSLWWSHRWRLILQTLLLHRILAKSMENEPPAGSTIGLPVGVGIPHFFLQIQVVAVLLYTHGRDCNDILVSSGHRNPAVSVYRKYQPSHRKVVYELLWTES